MAKKSLSKKKSAKKKTVRKKSAYDLVVVESPSKAKTIKKYLGRGYQVVASNGHIKDLPKSKLGIDVGKSFDMELVPIAGKQAKIDRIVELAKDANKIYLAPDLDREGEAIAFHIKDELPRKKEVYRVIFNAVTKNAVKAAMENPTELNKNMYDSQRTRRILDRLVGYKISPILWDKVQRGISAGRVQSPALRLIVERDEQIKEFKPEQWFSINGEFSKDQKAFAFKYYGADPKKKKDLKDEKETKKIVSNVKGSDYEIVEIKKRERKQKPTPPFTTSKLQQEASSKLGYTAKRTMMVAQRLYEGVELTNLGLQGLITYMRTDSVRTEPETLGELREFIKKSYGKDHLSSEEIIYKKKGKGKVQDAHESIRPTSLEFSPDKVKGDLEPEQLKLYTLIWNKFVSSQMAPAVIDQTSVLFECNGHYFKANGSIIKFPGFRTVYLETAAEKASKKNEEEVVPSGQVILPELNEGEKLRPAKDAQLLEHWTNPPPRYNEASLVKELEENGIGRPSTYASIISNLQDRRYVEKRENRFFATIMGTRVCNLLIQSFEEIMDVKFTAKMEDKLDLIEEGESKWKSVVKEFWKGFEPTLEKAKEEMKNLKKSIIPTDVKCQKCDDGIYHIRWGRNGEFLACSNYPECNSSHDFQRDENEKIHILPKDYHFDPCPTCGKRMVVKNGRYGRFLRCEEYPTCDTTTSYTIDVTCPKCKKGKFAEKKSRYGKIFYGCSRYPDCENALWTKPIIHDCPSCGYPIMCKKETKRDGKHLFCPECKHKVDDPDVND